MCEKPDEIMVRLSRIETRLCQVMEHLGMDPKDHSHKDDEKKPRKTQHGVWRPRYYYDDRED